MTAATRLRTAAALMRERADAVIEADPVTDWYTTKGLDTPFGRWAGDADAEHIASWHPAVARAVADWLDMFAAVKEAGAACAFEEQALVVADAYLLADAKADAR